MRKLPAPLRRLARPLVVARARRRHAAAGSALARSAAASPRLLAIGHWRFPVATQTFVYQELAALAAAGFGLRVAFSAKGPARDLAPRFAALAGLAIPLASHPAVGRTEVERYRRTRPAELASLLADLEADSGSGAEELLGRADVLRGFAFAALAEAFRADWLHSYFFYEGSLAAWIASRLLALPRGIVAYADHRLADHPLKLVRRQLADAALVVATSRRAARELTALCPAAAPRILLKPNSIDTEVFRERARPAAAPGDSVRALAVSRIDPKKGLLDLVEAAARLAAAGVAIELEIAGGADGSSASRAELARLRQRIRAAQPPVPVTLLGPLGESELLARLAAADLFVAPAVELPDGDADGIPTAVLEAMATGLPVVATLAGAIPEAVADGVEGRLVPPGDPARLAAALASLAADPAARARMGAAAARSARERFAAARVEPRLHERLRALVAPRL